MFYREKSTKTAIVLGGTITRRNNFNSVVLKRNCDRVADFLVSNKLSRFFYIESPLLRMINHVDVYTFCNLEIAGDF